MERFVRYGSNPLFEWHPKKAASNIKKHGIDFSEAILVFSDPNAVYGDGGVVDGEQRVQLFGTVGGRKLLVVIYVDYEVDSIEVIRIISARAADRREWKGYEERNGTLPN